MDKDTLQLIIAMVGLVGAAIAALRAIVLTALEKTVGADKDARKAELAVLDRLASTVDNHLERQTQFLGVLSAGQAVHSEVLRQLQIEATASPGFRAETSEILKFLRATLVQSIIVPPGVKAKVESEPAPTSKA